MAEGRARSIAGALAFAGLWLVLSGAAGLAVLSAIDIGLLKIGDASSVGGVAFKAANVFLIFGLVLLVAAHGERIGASIAMTALIVIGLVAVVPGVPKDAGGVITQALKPRLKEYRYDTATSIDFVNGRGRAQFALSTESYQDFARFTVDKFTMLRIRIIDGEEKIFPRFALFRRNPEAGSPEQELVPINSRGVGFMQRRFEPGEYILRIFVSSVRAERDVDALVRLPSAAIGGAAPVVATRAVNLSIEDVGPQSPIFAAPPAEIAPPYDRADEPFGGDLHLQWHLIDVAKLQSGDLCLAIEATAARDFDPMIEAYLVGEDGALGELIDENDDYFNNPLLLASLPPEKRAYYEDENQYGAFLLLTPAMAPSGPLLVYLLVDNFDSADGVVRFRLSVRETKFENNRCAAPPMSADVAPIAANVAPN